MRASIRQGDGSAELLPLIINRGELVLTGWNVEGELVEQLGRLEVLSVEVPVDLRVFVLVGQFYDQWFEFALPIAATLDVTVAVRVDKLHGFLYGSVAIGMPGEGAAVVRVAACVVVCLAGREGEL